MSIGIKKTVISTDYDEVEALIKKVYGVEYEIMPCEEVGSSQYAATYNQTIRKEPLDDYGQKEVEEFKAGISKMFILSDIMTDLCNNGHLDEGEYVIDVSW